MTNKKKHIHGVLLVNKPQGLTSNAVMQKLRWHFNAKKAGHTGSLDPMATGLLPICFGQATKVCEYLLGSSKRYTARVRLGQTTNTYDADGEVQETHRVDLSDAEIQKAVCEFRGEIQQVPPMFSALKKDGQPLYKLARQGKEIERPARKMTVYDISSRRINETDIDIDVHCSSGFYVRSLAHDLGQNLNCGGHLIALQRTAIKQITVEQSRSMDDLLESELENVLLPVDVLIDDMPVLHISDQQAKRLLLGQTVHLDTPDQRKERLRMVNETGELFAIGCILEKQRLKTEKIFVLS